MIDIRRLRVLRALADHGTVAAAAQALHLTPSAVSQQLAALEREVGQPVAERRGRGLVVTGAADVQLEHAHALFAPLVRAEAPSRRRWPGSPRRPPRPSRPPTRA